MKDQPIKPVQKGKSPSLMDTVKANQLITVVNALATMQVKPDGAGKFSYAGDTAILEFPAAADATRIDKLENIVRSLITSIQGSTINASCDANTNSINISLTYPNFPNANF